MGEKLYYAVKEFLTEVLFVTIAIVSFPFFLLFPLFFLPFILYRQLIKILARFFNPNAIGMMPLRNSVVAFDNWFTKPEQTIMIMIGLAKNFDFPYAQEQLEKIIERKDENGNLYCPELKRYFASWGGYLFWKPEKDYKLSDHLKHYNSMRKSPDRHVGFHELQDFCLDLVTKPYEKRRSPWSVYFVNNFQHPTLYTDQEFSVLVLRVHHGVCDGYSLLEYLTSAVDQWGVTKEKLPMANYTSGAIEPSWKDYAGMFLTAPYHSIKQGPGSFDINAFRINNNKLRKKLRTALMRFDLPLLKGISKKWGVTFSGLVYAAVSGGLRKFMLENGMDVPRYIHVGLPFPWPGRRDGKLQNRMCVGILKFPVGFSQLEERVRVADKLWRELKQSPAPLMNWTLMPVFGVLPGFLVKFFVRNNVTTAVLSNFPGPQEKIEFLGTTVEDIEFVTGLWRGNCGMGIAMLSVNGTMKIAVGVDEAILEQDQVDSLKGYIEREFQLLDTFILDQVTEV